MSYAYVKSRVDADALRVIACIARDADELSENVWNYMAFLIADNFVSSEAQLSQFDLGLEVKLVLDRLSTPRGRSLLRHFA